MRKLLVFLLNLVVLLSANPGVCAEAVDVIVGGTKISLPAPKGFYEVSKVSPDTRKIAEASTPPNNRLIAVFISEADLGRVMKGEDANLDRYMLVQVHRDSEGRNLPASQFQQLAQKLKQEHGTMVDREKAQSQLNQLSGGGSKEFGISLDVKVGQTVPLGVFADSLNFVAFATLAKYQVSIEKDKLDYLVANSTSFIRASNRLLFAYIYATYESQKDLDWLRIASQEWANDIISVNPSAVLAGKDQDATFNSSFNWDKVFSKAIAGAVVGGLFALISSIFRRKKTSVDTKKDGDA